MGVSSQIQLKESALNQKKSRLEELNKKFESQVKELKTTEKALQSMWTGDAAKQFDQSFTKDSESYDAFYKLVNKYVQALEQIMKAYENSEKANVQIAKTRSYK